MSLKFIKELEKNIKTKMILIEKGTVTPKESNIGTLFNKLKPLDEPSYDKLLSQYKKIITKCVK